MRFHTRILTVLFAALALFVVCFNVAETVWGLMNLGCWLISPDAGGHDACGRYRHAALTPVNVWIVPVTDTPSSLTQTSQPISQTSDNDHLSAALPVATDQTEAAATESQVSSLVAEQPPASVDVNCRPGETPDPISGTCAVLPKEEGFPERIASALAAGYRLLVKKSDELRAAPDVSASIKSSQTPVIPASHESTKALYHDIVLPNFADLPFLEFALSPRKAVKPQVTALDGSCGGDYINCPDLHQNCCHKQQSCCGLGCCAAGWQCAGREKGVCCRKGMTLCGDFCIAGECCPGGYACALEGETCCGLGEGGKRKDDERWHPRHQCCKKGEYCHGGNECRPREGEDSGTGRVVVGDVLGWLFG